MAKETLGEGLTNLAHWAKKKASDGIETVIEKVSEIDVKDTLTDAKEKIGDIAESAKETSAPVLTSVQEKTKEVGNRFSRAFKAFRSDKEK